ncbi:molybdopterin guanine dinucleotide-containing S/N-oxide reductase [Pseudooceanicola sp.]|uniref:molybdopterin guanine dinucleotide-containing S/N-oxide reductase n=1 Tax=Pseudooceanicola sp. TaxID=1914328 RepID=UPI00262CFF38|nr:molybdopterin guanine dinucleotide-containing S/N-oxide reductase [Pseudooceanicola sp.]MDF1855900.1 molybdopterin guanine dinucleotide-containing S/N-oxide reductase [Pseudooceanicola sp.]
MTRHTSSHWGVRVAETDAEGRVILTPHGADQDPNPIGLDQLDEGLQSIRVRRPAVRKSWLEHGPGARPDLRGHEPFVEVSWDRALDLAAAEIDRVRKTHGNAAVFGGSYGWSSAGRFHHAQSQVHRFLNTAGGYVRHLNSYSLGAARVIMPRVIAPMEWLMTHHTSWDVMRDHTKLLVCFGGVPWKNSQIAAGGMLRHHLRPGLKAMAEAGIRMINFGPVGDNLEADAEWVQSRPNTDTAVMLGMAHVLHSEGLADRAFLDRYCTGYDKFAAYLTGAEDGIARTPDWAEGISGVPADTIRRIAREMAGTRTMINMSWSLQRASHGEQPCWMLVTLSAMLGQIGLPGGGFGFGYGATNNLGSAEAWLPGPTLPQGHNAVSDFIPVARISEMLENPGAPFAYDGKTYNYPDIQLIYWAGGNPWHHHQDLNRLEKAWEKPGTVIVNEQYWTATAKHADIVLPATITAEREDIGYSRREGHLVAMRKLAEPIGEARDDYAIFTALAERLGCADAYTEGLDTEGWLRRMYEENRKSVIKRGIDLPDFEGFREQGLIDLNSHAEPIVLLEPFRSDPEANKLPTPSGLIEIFSETIDSFGLPDCPGHAVWLEPREWLGSAGEGMLHMLSDQPGRKLHSQLDASRYSRDGKVNGREQMHMNPEDAVARGIAAGDTVELSNDRGACLAAVCLNDRIMPGVVRLSTGAWHDPDETGRDRHGNPNVLTLDVGTSSLSQGSAAQTCLVRVSGPLNVPPCTTAFALPDFVRESGG